VKLEEEIHLTEAGLEVDREELEDAKQNLSRAGGDPQSVIQQLLNQHEASNQHSGNTSSKAQAVPEVQPRTFVVQLRSWRELAAKEAALTGAREEIKARQTQLAQERQALAPEVKSEGQEPQASPALPAASPDSSASSDRYDALKHKAAEHKSSVGLAKRAADFQQLDAVYGQWNALIKERKQEYQARLIEAALWILALLLLVVFANGIVRSLVARLTPESRRRHTIHTVARFAVQVIGVSLVLLVLFGPPSQLATVLALTGAGLTVALKDFIVGFFG
jgi:hypothetical protein